MQADITVDAATPRSSWTTGHGVVLLTALALAVVAWVLIAAPVFSLARAPAHGAHFGWTYAHSLAGTVMLFGGLLNVFLGAMRRFGRVHRIVGRTYLVAGTIAAVVAILLAVAGTHGAQGTALTRRELTDLDVALATLGGAWLITAAFGLRAARNRRFDSHRDWMIRSYVLTWSFVACRLLAFLPAVASFGDGAAAAWLAGVVPLLACEVALQWRHGAPLRRGALVPLR